MNAGPRFQHECRSCVFLGWYDGEDGTYDLYWCGGMIPTVISRWGGLGHEYHSGMLSMLPQLVEAKRRAAGRGLYVGDFTS